MKYLLAIITLVFIISCNKYDDNNIQTDSDNTDRVDTIPYCRYTLDGDYSVILASPDSADQRIYIGYGSGNIINTDTMFLSYSCSYIKSSFISQTELSIEFYKMEMKNNLAPYNDVYYYKNNADLTKNILFAGFKDYIQDNDLEFYPGVEISYRDASGNNWSTTKANQENSIFSIYRTTTTNTEEYGLSQKVEGTFKCTLLNTNNNSTMELHGSYLGYFTNPI